MTELKIIELLTEGSQADREKCLVKKEDCFYRYINRWGEEERACMIINEEIIKEDTAWMEQHNKSKHDRIDLEVACAYQKELEEEYLEILVEMDALLDRIHSLSVAIRKEKMPQYDPVEGESKEEKSRKAEYRVVYHKKYRQLVIADIAACVKRKTKDIKAYLFGQKLYWFRKNRNYAKEFREELSNTLEMVVKEYWNRLETDENAYMGEWKERHKESREEIRERLRSRARKNSYQQVFLYRTWGPETWMEIICCKFYHELNNHKPKENRKEWLEKKTSEWFYVEDKNVWRPTKKAVIDFMKCVDEEKRLDLLNYRIVLNQSMYEEISARLKRYGIKRVYLESKTATGQKGIYNRLKKRTEMELFTACTLWKECKFNFKDFFLVKEIEIPTKESEFRNKSRKVLEDAATIKDRMVNPERFEKNFDENFYWYTPMYGVKPIEICVWLVKGKRVKIKVTYGTFLMEPLVIELPYSGVMRTIEELDSEHTGQMIACTGYQTKEEILQYCAEIMARNYCKTILGISYEAFQRIKCHENQEETS